MDITNVTTNCISSCDMLASITDMTRKLARATAGAVRTCMLDAPDRPLYSFEPDPDIWGSGRFTQDMELLHSDLPGLDMTAVGEARKGTPKGWEKPIPELRSLFRIECELRGICTILEGLCKECGCPPSEIKEDDTIFYGNAETVLSDIVSLLHSTEYDLIPMLTLFADASLDAMLSEPGQDGQSDGASEWRWNIFGTVLPGLPAPGDLYPDFNRLMEEKRDEPELLELIRTDEALYTLERLLLLLYDAIPDSADLSSIQQCADMTTGRSEGNLGWSGGDGLLNTLIRLRYMTFRVVDLARRLNRDSSSRISPTNLSLLSEHIYNA